MIILGYIEQFSLKILMRIKREIISPKMVLGSTMVMLLECSWDTDEKVVVPIRFPKTSANSGFDWLTLEIKSSHDPLASLLILASASTFRFGAGWSFAL